MKKKDKIKAIIATLLIVSGVGIYLAAKNIGGFANWFNQYIYANISTFFARICNIFSFSVVEFVIYGLIIWAISSIVAVIIRKIKRKKSNRPILAKVITVYLVASMFVFLYVINCGVNYYRDSFVVREHLEKKDYDKEDLVKTCQYLCDQIIRLEKIIPKNADGTLKIDENLVDQAPKEMMKLSKRYKSLAGYYPDPKGLVISEILSYQGLSGVYSPFTVEANYNADMPDFFKAFTMLHELSHLRGFMQEEEANFISVLACTQSDEIGFQYSGYVMAYMKCINELRGYDLEAYGKIEKQLPKSIKLEFEKNNEFWAKYEGKIEEVSNKVNDTYLKANAQVQGVKSYNEVVGLIVANLPMN